MNTLFAFMEGDHLCASHYNSSMEANEETRIALTSEFNEEYKEGRWGIFDNVPADFSVDTYTIADGQLVKASAELLVERQASKDKATALVEIQELQAYLVSTDYAAIKCGELGLAMADTYPDLHAERTAARARINALQEGGAE